MPIPPNSSSPHLGLRRLLLKLPRFIKERDGSSAPRDGPALNALKQVLQSHYVALCSIHAKYAGKNASPSIEHIAANDFGELINDARILSGCGYEANDGGEDVSDPFPLSLDVVDLAFAAANVEIAAPSSRSPNGMRAAGEGLSPASVTEVNDKNHDKSLVRHEVIEALVRIAMKKFMQPPVVNTTPTDEMVAASSDAAEAMEMMLSRHVLRWCRSYDSNAFRRDRLYRVDVHFALQYSADELAGIYAEYASPKSSIDDSLLGLDEWFEMLKDAKLDGEGFSSVNCCMAFAQAQTKVTHELTGRSAAMRRRDAHNKLTFIEFLECICCLASMQKAEEMPGIPTLPPDSPLSVRTGRLTNLILECMRERSHGRESWARFFAARDEERRKTLEAEGAGFAIPGGVYDNGWVHLLAKDRPLYLPNGKLPSHDPTSRRFAFVASSE